MNNTPFKKYCFTKRDGVSSPYDIIVLGLVTESGVVYPTSKEVYDLTVSAVTELRNSLLEITDKGEEIIHRLQSNGLSYHNTLDPIKVEVENNKEVVKGKINALVVRADDEGGWSLTHDGEVTESIFLAELEQEIKEVDIVIDDTDYKINAMKAISKIDFESIYINKTIIGAVDEELKDLTKDILDAGFSPDSLSGLKRHLDGVKLLASNGIEEALGRHVDKSLSEALETSCRHDYDRRFAKLLPQHN